MLRFRKGQKRSFAFLPQREPSRTEIEKVINESRDNTLRELKMLIEQGFVATSGEARATVYTVTESAHAIVLWDAEDYLSQEPDKRHARYSGLESELFKTIKGIIGNVPATIEAAAEHRRKIGDHCP